jgi:hypothetical protein
VDSDSSGTLTSSQLTEILHSIPCVGEISREGKDAAGKLLESEFYYVPEMDTDMMRRDTVTQSLGKTSIRAARKQHKVCSPSLLTFNGCALTPILSAILLEAASSLSAFATSLTAAMCPYHRTPLPQDYVARTRV